MDNKHYYCPVEATIGAIGGKWKARIMWHLAQGICRFGEFKRMIPEITEKMLTQQLRELEADGLISRTEISGATLRVDYALTGYGQSLSPILTLMSEWGRQHIASQKKQGVGEDLIASN